MPSPKQPQRLANPVLPSPSRFPPLASFDASAISTTLPARDPMTENTDPGAIGAPGHRRRRSSLMNGSLGGVTSTTATTNTTTTTTNNTIASRISEDFVAEDAGDSWDDAWDDQVGDGDGKQQQRDRDRDRDSLLSDADLHDDEETGLTERERRRAREARQNRTQIDQRLVPGQMERGGPGDLDDNSDDPDFGLRLGLALDISEDERKQADKNVLRRLLLNGSLIGLWYLFSLSLSLYNKWMFGGSKLNFPFPLFTTAIHMLVQFLLSALVLYCVPSLRPGAKMNSTASDFLTDNDDNLNNDTIEQDEGNNAKPEEVESTYKPMTKWFYFTRIGPCGAATGLDIGLGNTSLKYITLTFYTMCKSSSLAFVLLFAFFFRLEKPTWRLVAIIATMTAGVVMMVAGEVEFKIGGFLLVISAAFFSGFRWGLTQILLLRNPATSNPFSSIFYLAPVMFVTLFAIALPSEGFGALLGGIADLVADKGPLLTPLIIVFPGTIAFLMTASEFALLQRTSVVTLSIAGIFKEVVTITTATLVFHDTLTLVNFLGLVVTMAAITAYNYIKITRMRQQAQVDVHRDHTLRLSRRPSMTMAMAEDGPSSGGAGGPLMVDASSSLSTSPAEVDADSENAGLLHKHSS